MIRKKDKITLIVLASILLALILVFALAVAPLLKEESEGRLPPEIFDGEYTNGSNVSVYKPISDNDLLKITVKKMPLLSSRICSQTAKHRKRCVH